MSKPAISETFIFVQSGYLRRTNNKDYNSKYLKFQPTIKTFYFEVINYNTRLDFLQWSISIEGEQVKATEIV